MNGFVAALQKFGIGRLAAILGIGAGVAAALFALTMNLGEPKALLYSNLDLKEAGAITTALDQAGTKYEVKGDGSTIMVPRDEVAATRLMLSGKGLPTSGSVGYEIFDSSNALGQTDFVQQLNRQRALEGELARTIQSLEGVQSARVHLVLPKRQLFEEEAEQPTASVTITAGGRAPDADKVRAIQNLIAGAVPNLTPDRVTIVDHQGKTLSGGEAGMAGAADERRSEIEQRIAKTVKNLVEGVVGPGKARVNVTADLDLASVTVQQETFDPDGQVVRSETTTEENSRESQPTSAGGVSASANIPGGTLDGEEDQTSAASGSTQSTTNYEISKTTRTEVQAPGQVKRLSVAVAVDGLTAAGADGKPGAYTPRSAQEMQRIEQLVRTAVGFNTDRGDQVTVVNVRFPAADASGGVEASNPLMGFDKNDIMRAAELGILALVALLMMLFIVRPLLKSAGAGGGGGRALPALTAPGGPGVTRIVTTENGQAVQIPVDPTTGEPLALPGPNNELDQRIDIARIEGQVKASSVKRVAEFVDNHPEESVSLLRTWLHETT